MRNKKLFLLTLLPMLLLTGCWDKKDPEDRAFIITLGADSSGTGCSFTFAPANIETGEAETYTAESETLAGAVAQADTHSSRKTDLGQLKTVILGRGLLEDSEKLESFLRELERSQQVSEKVMLLAVDGSAAECVEAAMAEDSKTGLFLWDFYKNTAGEVAVTKGLDLDTFLAERAEQGGCGVIPRIAAEEGKLKLGGGMAVTPTAVYPMSNAEERGYLFLLGEAEGALLEGSLRGEEIPIEIIKSDVRYGFLETEKGILCQVRLPLEGALQGGELFFLPMQKEIEEIFAGIIKEEVTHTLKIAVEAEEDIFGILPRLQRAMPDLAEGADRKTLWQSLEFEIVLELEIKDMGQKR